MRAEAIVSVPVLLWNAILFRRLRRGGTPLGRLFLVDVGVATMGAILFSLLAPPGHSHPGGGVVSAQVVVGAGFVWPLLIGPRAGVQVLVAYLAATLVAAQLNDSALGWFALSNSLYVVITLGISTTIVYVLDAVQASVRDERDAHLEREHQLQVEAAQRRTRRDAADWLHDHVVNGLELALTDALPAEERDRILRRELGRLKGFLATAQELPEDADGLVDAAALVREAVGDLDGDGFRVRLATDGQPRLQRRRAIALAGATREGVLNARKHAGTDEVEVRLAGGDDGVRVVVVDHGVGFEPATAARRPGGLDHSIRGRIAAADGQVVVTSAPGEGTTVAIRLPTPATGAGDA